MSAPAAAPAAAADRRPAAALVALAQIAVRLFFREVEIVGAERLPEGPLLVVANHQNALVDPALLLAALPRRARFLAKSTLWAIAPLRPFLAAAGAIPVHRRKDEGEVAAEPGGPAGGSAAERNRDTFARAAEVLAAGGAIALFPEGISHDAPALAPLKTGAARMALAAAAEGVAVRIAPVGLLFDAKGTFRSRALVEIGEPLALSADEARAGDAPDAVRALTARIDAALRTVTVNTASWRDARVLARAADLWERDGVALPGERRLAEAAALRRAFARGEAALAGREPGRLAAVRRAVERYDRVLRALGLRDDQVAARYPAGAVVAFVLRRLALLAVAAPLAALGILVNALPYTLVASLARLFGTSEDLKATVKIFAGLLAYPATWIAAALLAGRAAGVAGGVAALVAAPALGVVAMLVVERAESFAGESRAFLLLGTRRGLARELRARRAAVVAAVEETAARLAAPADGPTRPAAPAVRE